MKTSDLHTECSKGKSNLETIYLTQNNPINFEAVPLELLRCSSWLI